MLAHTPADHTLAHLRTRLLFQRMDSSSRSLAVVTVSAKRVAASLSDFVSNAVRSCEPGVDPRLSLGRNIIEIANRIP